MKKKDMNQAYQDKLNDINENAKRARHYVQVVAERFPELPEVLGIWKDVFDASSWFSTNYGGLVSITIRDLTTFRGENLINLLAAVETYFNVELSMRDRPELAMKVFEAKVDWASDGTFDISVEAYLSSEQSRCQRIQVGTKVITTETPIFELHCPESEA